MAAATRAGTDDYAVTWEPQAGPQTALLSCPVFEIFFGGARGGGKTDGMLGEWVSHQDLYGENASGLMIRRTLRDLEDTIKRSRIIYWPLGAKFSEQDKVWKFPNGAEIKFRYLDNDKDADHYQGHSYTRVYVEEIGQFPSPDPVYKLMATLRSAANVPCGFRATGNPGGPGHQWVKSRYIDPAPMGWRIVWTDFKNPWNGNVIRRDRVFIPSQLKDNKFLGDDYVANLQMSGNQNLVKAWLEGDWSVIEGAFFPEWNSAKHVLDPFKIPNAWFRFRSADWGSARPFSIGWWAVVGDTFKHGPRLLPRGALIRYREYYGASAPNVGLKMPAEMVADKIKEMEMLDPIPEGESMKGVLDPSAFASDGGPCIAERMSKRGVWFRPADNARVSQRGAMGGWDQLRSRLIGEDGRPMIYFFSTCKDAIRTVPALQHDIHRPEDVDSEGEDHAADEVRYACMSRPYIRKEVPKEPLRGMMDMTLDELWDAQPRRTDDKRI
jgi:hypothetical protein